MVSFKILKNELHNLVSLFLGVLLKKSSFKLIRG